MKRYKTREGIVLLSVKEEHMLIADREAREHCTYVQQINDAAAFYWKLLEQGTETEKIIMKAAEKYNLTKKDAAKTVISFLRSLYKKGYLVPVGEPESDADGRLL